MDLLKILYLVVVISGTFVKAKGERAVTNPHPLFGATYTSMAGKWCVFPTSMKSVKGVVKSADECKKKCTDDPKCVSAEWWLALGGHPPQCYTSRTCTAMAIAPRYTQQVYVVSYVKNICTCANGTPKSGASCTSNGATMCLSCDEGYIIKPGESACRDPRFFGATYTSMAGKWCFYRASMKIVKGVVKSGHECKNKCTDDPKCVSAEWLEFEGQPPQCRTSRTCTSNKMVPLSKYIRSQVNAVSYVKNICTCANGTPKSGASCTSNGATMCLSCVEGYIIKPGESACGVNIGYELPHHDGPVVVVHGRRLRGRSDV